MRRYIVAEAFRVKDAAVLSRAQLIILARLIPGVAIGRLDRDVNDFQCSIGQCFLTLLMPAELANVDVTLVKALLVDEEIETFLTERSAAEQGKDGKLAQEAQAPTP